MSETGGGMAYARHAFRTVAQPHGVGIAEFGIAKDPGAKDEEPIALDYRLLASAAGLILPLRDAGRVCVAIEEDGIAAMPIAFDGVDLVARFGEVRDGCGGPRGQGSADLSGHVLVLGAQAAPDRFLLTSASADLLFRAEAPPARRGAARDDRERPCRHQPMRPRRLPQRRQTTVGPILPADGRSPMVTIQGNP